VDSQIFVGL